MPVTKKVAVLVACWARVEPPSMDTADTVWTTCRGSRHTREQNLQITMQIGQDTKGRQSKTSLQALGVWGSVMLAPARY